MKYLLGYWVIGCLLVGSASASRLNHCPTEKVSSAFELLAVVAVWPVAISAGIFVNHDISRPCESVVTYRERSGT